MADLITKSFYQTRRMEQEQLAGAELQSYLEKIGGVALPLVTEAEKKEGPAIWIGNHSGQEGLNEHAIRIMEENDDLFISGGDPESTLFATYTFLEDVSRLPVLCA